MAKCIGSDCSASGQMANNAQRAGTQTKTQKRDGSGGGQGKGGGAGKMKQQGK